MKFDRKKTKLTIAPPPKAKKNRPNRNRPKRIPSTIKITMKYTNVQRKTIEPVLSIRSNKSWVLSKNSCAFPKRNSPAAIALNAKRKMQSLPAICWSHISLFLIPIILGTKPHSDKSYIALQE